MQSGPNLYDATSENPIIDELKKREERAKKAAANLTKGMTIKEALMTAGTVPTRRAEVLPPFQRRSYVFLAEARKTFVLWGRLNRKIRRSLCEAAWSTTLSKDRTKG